MLHTLTIVDRLGCNLAPSYEEQGAFIQSFYASNSATALLQHYDTIHSVNGLDVSHDAFENICQCLLTTERPYTLAVRRAAQKSDLTRRDLVYLIGPNSDAPLTDEEKDLIRAFAALQEFRTILQRSNALEPQAHELILLRFPRLSNFLFGSLENIEDMIERAIIERVFPLLSAYFQHSTIANDCQEDTSIISFLPSCAEEQATVQGATSVYSFLCEQVGTVDLIKLHDPSLGCLVCALYHSDYIATTCSDNKLHNRPPHISLHRPPLQGPPSFCNSDSDYDSAAVYELLNSKNHCVLLCSLLLERSVLFIYNDRRNVASVQAYIDYTQACLRPLLWLHITDACATAALLDSPFPFLCGIARSSIDDDIIKEIKEHVCVFDIEYSTFSFPLPKVVQSNLHGCRRLQKDLDAVLRPKFCGPQNSDLILHFDERVIAIKRLSNAFVAELVGPLRRACFVVKDEQSKGGGQAAALLNEKMYIDGVKDVNLSEDFLRNFLRSQHVSNHIVTELFGDCK